MRFLVSSYLEGQIGVDLVKAENDQDADSMLRKSTGEGIHLVVCPWNGPLQAWVTRQLGLHPEVHFFCFSEKPDSTSPSPQVHFLSEPDWTGSFSQLLAQYLGKLTPTLVAGSHYCKIYPEILFFVSPLPTAIFVRISDEKFIRVMPAGASFDQTDYDSFIVTKGFKAFYVKREDAPQFFNLSLPFVKPKVAATVAPPPGPLSLRRMLPPLTNRLTQVRRGNTLRRRLSGNWTKSCRRVKGLALIKKFKS